MMLRDELSELDTLLFEIVEKEGKHTVNTQ